MSGYYNERDFKMIYTVCYMILHIYLYLYMWIVSKDHIVSEKHKMKHITKYLFPFVNK